MKLEAYFPYKLASTAEAFSRRLVDVYGRTFGLSREEWRLLLLLADAGELTSLELAKRTTLDKVQVSRAAAKLEEKGLITRSVPKSDRRLRVYTCSDEGQRLFANVFPQVEACANAMLRNMKPDDLEALTRGLQALEDAVVQYSHDQKTE